MPRCRGRTIRRNSTWSAMLGYPGRVWPAGKCRYRRRPGLAPSRRPPWRCRQALRPLAARPRLSPALCRAVHKWLPLWLCRRASLRRRALRPVSPVSLPRQSRPRRCRQAFPPLLPRLRRRRRRLAPQICPTRRRATPTLPPQRLRRCRPRLAQCPCPLRLGLPPAFPAAA